MYWIYTRSNGQVTCALNQHNQTVQASETDWYDESTLDQTVKRINTRLNDIYTRLNGKYSRPNGITVINIQCFKT